MTARSRGVTTGDWSHEPGDSGELDIALAAVGRGDTRRERLDPESLRRFDLAIGGDGDVDRRQPTLGHWAWFLPRHGDGAVGEDGHPARGGFLPAFAGLPRRMFAAATIRFDAPLRLDVQADAMVRIANVTHKNGRSGELMFVDIERTIGQRDMARVIERQTIVYRAGDGAPLSMPAPEPDADAMPANGAVWWPGPVNLFRFSAATGNGHRIHYDEPYATAVEGYPALIVHGPFIAARLAQLAARAGPLASFAFRAVNPCFVDQPIRLVDAGGGAFVALRCDGATAVTAEARFRYEPVSPS